MLKVKKIPILLDRERTLLFDVNALIDLGEELGVNLLTEAGWKQLVESEPSFQKVRAIVWAGLRHEDEKLTVRQVGAMLDPADLGPVIKAYQSAWEASDEKPGDTMAPEIAAPLVAAAQS